MKHTYKLTADTIIDELGNEHIVYGIAITNDTSDIPERVISDIFGERDAAEWFVELCNRLELSPDQLDDAVADVIAA